MAEKQTASQSGPEKIDETEMAELKSRLEKLEGRLGKENLPEQREAEVKREIKNYLSELQQTPSFSAPVSTRDQKDEIDKFPPNQQVGALISLVFEKGLREAVSLANQIGNPAILDEFHDLLVDRYYQELLKKGILKQ